MSCLTQLVAHARVIVNAQVIPKDERAVLLDLGEEVRVDPAAPAGSADVASPEQPRGDEPGLVQLPQQQPAPLRLDPVPRGQPPQRLVPGEANHRSPRGTSRLPLRVRCIVGFRLVELGVIDHPKRRRRRPVGEDEALDDPLPLADWADDDQ